MIRGELMDSIRQNTLLGLIIILLIATGLVFVGIGLLGFNRVNGYFLDFSSKYEENHIYALYDPFNSNDILQAFLDEGNSEERLMRFYARLANNPYFQYLDLNDQSILVQDYAGPDKFVDGYKEGWAESSKSVKLNGRLYRSVKGMQFGEPVFSIFKPQLQSGRNFLPSEYEYQEGMPIPLILGSEYKGLYALGDQINIDFLGLQSKAKVVGFFAKDSYVFLHGDICYLDRRMVMPSLEFDHPPLGAPIPDYLFRFYHLKTSGYILSQDLNADRLQVLINQFCRECRLDGWQIEGAHVTRLDILNTEGHKFFIMFLTISAVVFLFTFISIILSLSLKIKKNLPTYAVHLISGATIGNIKWMIAAEIAFYLIIANILAAVFSLFRLGYIGFNPVPLLISTVIGFTALIIPFRQIDRLDVSIYLRGKR